MAKLKKYQQVEIFLNKLLQRDDFSLQDLARLKHQDISGAKELRGIGVRTISNVLCAFKIRKGIRHPKKKTTKRKLVVDFLTYLLDYGKISQRELQVLTYNDLKDIEELAEVGKTTITCALSEFKQDNNKDTFETGVLDFLAKDKSTNDENDEIEEPVEEDPQPEISEECQPEEESHADNLPLNHDNVELIKKMINEFSQLKVSDEEKKLYELRELKHALHFVGINPSKIVRLYWEDISKDFMSRKILSGKAPTQTDLRVGSFI